jgi:hypothetical protein
MHWLRTSLLAAAATGAMEWGSMTQASPYQNAPPAMAAEVATSMTDATIEGCVLAAANLHQLPPAVLVILLNVEGGTIGHVSENRNDTVDIGPMQVNDIWLPSLAQHWHASISDTFEALRDNFCANLEGGAWILRLALDEARNDFWTGVAIYHSHDPGYQTDYLRKVLRQTLILQRLAGRGPAKHEPTG